MVAEVTQQEYKVLYRLKTLTQIHGPIPFHELHKTFTDETGLNYLLCSLVMKRLVIKDVAGNYSPVAFIGKRKLLVSAWQSIKDKITWPTIALKQPEVNADELRKALS